MSSGVAVSRRIGAVAHHVDAQRQVRDLRGDVDRARAALQLVHELREGFPLPVQAGGQHRVGNFLDALHQVHQRAVMFLLHRREADAAVAEHHRGDAVPARRREQRVPHRLPVVVRVHVDPAGRDQEPIGIDVALGRALLAADRRDAAVRDRNVAGKGRLSGAIDDGAAANDDVVHGTSLPDLRATMMRLGPWRRNAPAAGLFTARANAWRVCGHAAHEIVRGGAGRYAASLSSASRARTCMIEVVREAMQVAIASTVTASARFCIGRPPRPRPGW